MSGFNRSVLQTFDARKSPYELEVLFISPSHDLRLIPKLAPAAATAVVQEVGHTRADEYQAADKPDDQEEDASCDFEHYACPVVNDLTMASRMLAMQARQ